MHKKKQNKKKFNEFQAIYNANTNPFVIEIMNTLTMELYQTLGHRIEGLVFISENSHKKKMHTKKNKIK